jgi:hypothetical protein
VELLTQSLLWQQLHGMHPLRTLLTAENCTVHYFLRVMQYWDRCVSVACLLLTAAVRSWACPGKALKAIMVAMAYGMVDTVEFLMSLHGVQRRWCIMRFINDLLKLQA